MSRIETHDYTVRHWGHDYTFKPIDGGMKGSIIGWGSGLKDGDYLLLEDPRGGSSRYQIDSIEYFSNPSDMWSANVKFAPRKEADNG